MLLDFITQHLETIIYCLLALVIFVLTLVKKKPVLNKIDEVHNFILEVLPSLILQCEKPGYGEEKKALVMNEIKLLLAKKFNYFEWDSICDYVSKAIESYLCTPQKKGD